MIIFATQIFYKPKKFTVFFQTQPNNMSELLNLIISKIKDNTIKGKDNKMEHYFFENMRIYLKKKKKKNPKKKKVDTFDYDLINANDEYKALFAFRSIEKLLTEGMIGLDLLHSIQIFLANVSQMKNEFTATHLESDLENLVDEIEVIHFDMLKYVNNLFFSFIFITNKKTIKKVCTKEMQIHENRRIQGVFGTIRFGEGTLQ